MKKNGGKKQISISMNKVHIDFEGPKEKHFQ